MAMPENTYVPDGNTVQRQETPPPAETQPTADPPEPDRLSDDEDDCERSPEDLLDMHMEAIAVRGAQSDLTVAQASAALYTLKRQRGDGQDLALAQQSLDALARHAKRHAGAQDFISPRPAVGRACAPGQFEANPYDTG